MGRGQRSRRNPLLTARRRPATKRLADRLLARSRIQPAPWSVRTGADPSRYWSPSVERAVRTALASVPVIAADNVADYFFSLPPGSDLKFPNLAPPFASFWIEARTPPHANLDYPKSIGALFGAVELPAYAGFASAEDEAASAKLSREERALQLMHNWRASLDDAAFRDEMLAALDQSRWLVQWSSFYEIDDTTVGPVMKALLFVDDSGAVVKMLHSPAALNSADQLPDDATMQFHIRLLWPLLFSISLMHCKNVSVQTAGMSPALSKAHQKKSGRPLLRYRTLAIGPMTRVLNLQGSAGTSGLGQALHICHSHFKDCSARGLFGKLRGTYWWPEHVRGSAEIGTVAKTYNVTPHAGP